MAETFTTFVVVNKRPTQRDSEITNRGYYLLSWRILNNLYTNDIHKIFHHQRKFHRNIQSFIIKVNYEEETLELVGQSSRKRKDVGNSRRTQERYVFSRDTHKKVRRDKLTERSTSNLVWKISDRYYGKRWVSFNMSSTNHSNRILMEKYKQWVRMNYKVYLVFWG